MHCIPYSFIKEKYHLLACDGSSFTFTRNPNEPDSYFPPNGKTTSSYNQFHIIPLFDLLSKRYCNCIVQYIRKKNEFQALYTLIDRYHTPSGGTPTFIADQRFHSFNVFFHTIEHGSFFLIRTKDVNMKHLLGQDFQNDTQTIDIQAEHSLIRTQPNKKWLHPELADQYRFICKNVTFDYIDLGKNEYPVSLRLLRSKISEGNYENPAGTCPMTYHKFFWSIPLIPA